MGDARKTISSGDVDRARIALLKSIYDENESEEIGARRRAVRQLMGPIIAARKSGKSFELISKILADADLQISPSTLRSYYFDFKAEVEASKVTSRLVKQVLETSDQLNMVRATKKGADAHRSIAKEAGRKLASKMKLVSTAEMLADRQLKSDPDERPAKPPASAPRVPSTPSRKSATSTTPPPQSTPRTPEKFSGKAPTLEDLRKHAENAEGREELSEDVVLKADNRAYYASGEPFDGMLTARQIRLLEVSRRLVAPKKDGGSKRTAGSFTTLPDKL